MFTQSGEVAVTFEESLERAGITKAELARRLGVNPRTVSMWKDEPPQYAMVYILLLIEYNRIRP